MSLRLIRNWAQIPELKWKSQNPRSSFGQIPYPRKPLPPLYLDYKNLSRLKVFLMDPQLGQLFVPIYYISYPLAIGLCHEYLQMLSGVPIPKRFSSSFKGKVIKPSSRLFESTLTIFREIFRDFNRVIFVVIFHPG